MPKRAISLSCLALVLATAGCTQTGAFFDPTAEIKGAVAEALEHLAAQPAVMVAGDVSILGGHGLAQADLGATVLHDGTGWTSFSTEDGANGEMLSLPESIHFRADDDFWKGEDYPFGVTETMDDAWTRMAPTDWFNPATMFAPPAFAPLLHEELIETAALQIPTPETVDVDGVTAFPVEHAGGVLHVSAEAPHRFLGIEGMLLSLRDPVSSVRRAGTFTVVLADQGNIAELEELAAEALPEMTEPFSLTGSADLEVLDSDLTCAPGIACVATLEVRVELHIADFTDEVVLIQSATVDGGSLGTKTCSSQADVTADETVELSCLTTFTPTSGGRLRFEGSFLVNWVGRYSFDTDKAADALAATIAEITAG